MVFSRNRNTNADEINEHKIQKCQKATSKYQSKYVSYAVEPMSSTDLIALQQQQQQQQTKKSPKLILVDCRTKEEQNVSMIAGAIRLQEFEHQLKNDIGNDHHNHNHFDENNNDTIDPKTIVCYCTVGARSGMEATRLLQNYFKTDETVQIYNLDGIVAYTQALQQLEDEEKEKLMDNSNNNNNSKKTLPNVGLVHPVSSERVYQVHVFAGLWDWVLLDSTPAYNSVSYAPHKFAFHLLQVGTISGWRAVQRWSHRYVLCDTVCTSCAHNNK